MKLLSPTEIKKAKNQTRIRTSLAERFGRYVYLNNVYNNANNSNNNKNHIKNNCWCWMGTRNDRGYGVIGNGTRKKGVSKAHRVSYELFHFTKLEKDKCVCHACDNPACVNPQHLFVGTQADNVADMIAKGRNVLPPVRKGKKSNSAKLNNKKIRQIRKLARDGFLSRKIAREFEVSKTTIFQIVKRKSWRHV